METAKKLLKKKNGFTLVELIVVLVILAILAAILVPTLLGYINKAQDEKNYSTAQTVRVAAQAVYDDEVGHKTNADTTIDDKDQTASGQKVTDLAGVDTKKVTSYNFTVDANGQITGGTVVIDGATYTLGNDGTWTASK
ncbi:type II secretion system protein [Hugonella massiliensis]|uniref:type II secretion system protein n=1 Tax=Hugonella massiliensis TaxID=1720315 RepID=UPI00073E70B2|nr:type II secretion system protein [Hugonella massiliensis]